jgi:flagellar motor switch/type III secretory pathway protein FliN
MVVTPYKIFTNVQLAQSMLRVNAVLNDWNRKWLRSPDSKFFVTSIQNAYDALPAEPDGNTISIDRATTNGSSLFRLSSKAASELYGHATGDRLEILGQHTIESTMPGQLVKKMVQDFLIMLESANSQKSTVISSDAPRFAKGSGTLVISLAGSDWMARCVVSHNIATTLVDTQPSAINREELTTRRAAIGSGRLKVRATAGSVTLSLANLSELRPGDVLRLDVKTTQAFELENAETYMKICHAFLGQRDNHKALQLSSQP